MRRPALILLLSVFLSGCFTVATPQKSANEMKPIAVGMTMEQVRKNFGPPDEVPQAGEDSQMWEYEFRMPDQTAEIHFNQYGEVEQINDLPGRYIKSSY